MRALAALLTISLAAPAAAREPRLNLPVDCTLGDDCFIQYHVDRDPSPGAADYRCNPRTYDGHNGTDIALPSLLAMERGVDVLAAAPGTVLRIRNSMRERAADEDPGATPDDKGCGNGAVIDHGGGWETQYCHMALGTPTVRPGQRVSASTVIGQVGLSGFTEFPHLHFIVRHDGAVVDPFDPDILPVDCAVPRDRTLWRDDIGYAETGLIAAGFAPQIPEYSAVKAGTAGYDTLSADAGALVLWGYGFASEPGDDVRFRIDGPAGAVLDTELTLDKRQAQYFRAAGKRARAPWPPGTYTGTVTLARDGAEIATRTATVTVQN